MWKRQLVFCLSVLILAACGASSPAPLPTASSTPLVVPTDPQISATPTNRSARSVLPPTIAVAIVPTLPPIIVTNPLPSATPWPTEIPPTEDTVYVMTLTAIAAAPRTPTLEVPSCRSLPTPTVETTAAAVEHFETGLMFWLQTRNEIWVLINSPAANQFYWRVLPNQWSEGIPESDPSLTPPPGRFQPGRGFGYAWRIGSGSTDAQRPDLGWAIDEEAGFTTSLIYYPQGFYSPDCTWQPKSGIYEMKDNQGKAYQFVGEGGIAKLITP